MEQMNIVTKSYKYKEKYQIDLVITTDDKGNVTTDVWIGHVGGALKMFMFDIKNRALDEVMELIEAHLETDVYTDGIDKEDIYER